MLQPSPSLGQQFRKALHSGGRDPNKWTLLLPILLAEKERGTSLRDLARACTEVGYPISHTQLDRRLKAIAAGKALPEDTVTTDAQRLGEQAFGPGPGPNPLRRLMGEEVACAGCEFVTAVPGSMSVLALPQAGHPGRWYIHRAACAAKAGYNEAAQTLEICEAADVWPVTCDPQGRVLPEWRIREIRQGIAPTKEEIESPPPPPLAVAPLRPANELSLRDLRYLEQLDEDIREGL